MTTAVRLLEPYTLLVVLYVVFICSKWYIDISTEKCFESQKNLCTIRIYRSVSWRAVLLSFLIRLPIPTPPPRTILPRFRFSCLYCAIVSPFTTFVKWHRCQIQREWRVCVRVCLLKVVPFLWNSLPEIVSIMYSWQRKRKLFKVCTIWPNE